MTAALEGRKISSASLSPLPGFGQDAFAASPGRGRIAGMDLKPESKDTLGPVIEWGLILHLPSLLAFTVIACGGLRGWVPLFPDGRGLEAFVAFNVGYILGVYLLARSYDRKHVARLSSQCVQPPAPNPDAPSESK